MFCRIFDKDYYPRDFVQNNNRIREDFLNVGSSNSKHNSNQIEGFLSLGGKSKSKLKVTQTADYNVVNKNEVDIAVNDLNQLIQETFVRNAQSCAATASQTQSVGIGDIVATGGAKIDVGGITMDQNAKLNFECVQVNKLRSDIGNEIVSKFMTDLQTNTSNEMLAQLDAIANQKAESGSIPLLTSPAETKGEQTQTINFNSTTENYKNIEKNLQNIVQNTVTQETISDCLAQLSQSQTVQIGNIVATDLGTEIKLGGVTLKQTLEVVSNCMQSNDLSTQIISTMLNSMDVRTVDTTTTTMAGEATSDVEQTAVSKGPIGEIGEAFGNIFGGIFGALGLGAAGPAVGGVSSSISLCCCCLIIILIIIAVMT